MANLFKENREKLELLTENDMLLMFDKVIRGGICHAVHRYAKANNKYLKNYDRNKESSFLEYLDENILYGWEVYHKLPIDGFKWIETSLFDEKLINLDK